MDTLCIEYQYSDTQILNVTAQKTNMVTKWERGWRRINQEFGINRYKLLYMKQVNNKVLLYSTVNYNQYSVISHNGKEMKKNIYVYTYMLQLLLSRFSRVRLCATPQTAATRLPRPWDSPGKTTGVGCHFLLQCRKVKSESEVTQCVRLLATPWTAAHQAPPSMGFSRQGYWSGVPLPSPYTYIDTYIYIYIYTNITESLLYSRN